MQLEGLVIPVSFDTGLLLKGLDMITDLIEGAVTATFEWADGMDHLGDVTGMTAEQTAAWSFVAQKAGVSVDALANSTTILEKGLFDSKGELANTGKALENFGISVKDSSGHVKDQSTLMNDIAEKYKTFGTQQEKVNFLTEIFGRQGANLVDVFDVLAEEGGIDAVEQKVKDLGLALDPDRYEQFNRNLEELKLAGTGLAIQITEALMPAFEGILSWAKQFEGMSFEQIFARIGEMIGAIDWNAVGKSTAKGLLAVQKFIVDWINKVDWGGLFKSIGTAFMDFATGLNGGDFATFKAQWQSNWNGARDIVTNAIAAAKVIVANWLKSLPQSIQIYFQMAYLTIKTWVDKILSILGLLGDALSGAGSTGTAPVGSTVGHQATGGWAGGMTWVGENGPELVNLPGGSYVNHNQSSNRMAQQGPLQAYIDYDELARTFARVLGMQMQRA